MRSLQKPENPNFRVLDKVIAGKLEVSTCRALPPSLSALIAQTAATAATLILLMPVLGLLGVDLALVPAAFVQGGLAAAVGAGLGSAPWWLPIHLLFAPGLVWVLSFDISPLWFLAAFLLLSLAYWSVFGSQVPLYLSSRKAWTAVADLLPEKPGFALLDVGAGLGGMLGYLSTRRPDGHFHGMEIAPLPFALAWLRNMAGRGGFRIKLGNYWKHRLAAYDVVYAYLSPVPMEKLWAKACAEMAPGSHLISNTFAVPEVEPAKIIDLDDFHHSRLYVYRIPARPGLGSGSS